MIKAVMIATPLYNILLCHVNFNKYRMPLQDCLISGIFVKLGIYRYQLYTRTSCLIWQQCITVHSKIGASPCDASNRSKAGALQRLKQWKEQQPTRLLAVIEQDTSENYGTIANIKPIISESLHVIARVFSSCDGSSGLFEKHGRGIQYKDKVFPQYGCANAAKSNSLTWTRLGHSRNIQASDLLISLISPHIQTANRKIIPVRQPATRKKGVMKPT